MLVGIDEVGRGCWAGPLVAAAVVLTRPVSGLTDSKKLNKSTRAKLAVNIKDCSNYGIGWVGPNEVDRIGLTAATSKAMFLALSKIINKKYSEILIDGNFNYLAPYLSELSAYGQSVDTLVNADELVPQVSAASIIAKVARDDYMRKAAKKFPGYGFDKHVGYGTAEHRLSITKLGPCSLHRMSYSPLKALTR